MNDEINQILFESGYSNNDNFPTDIKYLIGLQKYIINSRDIDLLHPKTHIWLRILLQNPFDFRELLEPKFSRFISKDYICSAYVIANLIKNDLKTDNTGQKYFEEFKIFGRDVDRSFYYKFLHTLSTRAPIPEFQEFEDEEETKTDDSGNSSQAEGTQSEEEANTNQTDDTAAPPKIGDLKELKVSKPDQSQNQSSISPEEINIQKIADNLKRFLNIESPSEFIDLKYKIICEQGRHGFIDPRSCLHAFFFIMNRINSLAFNLADAIARLPVDPAVIYKYFDQDYFCREGLWANSLLILGHLVYHQKISPETPELRNIINKTLHLDYSFVKSIVVKESCLFLIYCIAQIIMFNPNTLKNSEKLIKYIHDKLIISILFDGQFHCRRAAATIYIEMQACNLVPFYEFVNFPGIKRKHNLLTVEKKHFHLIKNGLAFKIFDRELGMQLICLEWLNRNGIKINLRNIKKSLEYDFNDIIREEVHSKEHIATGDDKQKSDEKCSNENKGHSISEHRSNESEKHPISERGPNESEKHSISECGSNESEKHSISERGSNSDGNSSDINQITEISIDCERTDQCQPINTHESQEIKESYNLSELISTAPYEMQLIPYVDILIVYLFMDQLHKIEISFDESLLGNYKSTFMFDLFVTKVFFKHYPFYGTNHFYEMITNVVQNGKRFYRDQKHEDITRLLSESDVLFLLNRNLASLCTMHCHNLIDPTLLYKNLLSTMNDSYFYINCFNKKYKYEFLEILEKELRRTDKKKVMALQCLFALRLISQDDTKFSKKVSSVYFPALYKNLENYGLVMLTDAGYTCRIEAYFGILYTNDKKLPKYTLKYIFDRNNTLRDIVISYLREIKVVQYVETFGQLYFTEFDLNEVDTIYHSMLQYMYKYKRSIYTLTINEQNETSSSAEYNSDSSKQSPISARKEAFPAKVLNFFKCIDMEYRDIVVQVSRELSLFKSGAHNTNRLPKKFRSYVATGVFSYTLLSDRTLARILIDWCKQFVQDMPHIFNTSIRNKFMCMEIYYRLLGCFGAEIDFSLIDKIKAIKDDNLIELREKILRRHQSILERINRVREEYDSIN